MVAFVVALAQSCVSVRVGWGHQYGGGLWGLRVGLLGSVGSLIGV